MDPSSLIFVAVIGIWAAYLLGHWVRRRDQLATARSIDRFSEGMRVLERRAPAPTVSTSPARAHVVAARVTGPGVTASTRDAATGSASRTTRGRTVRPSVTAPVVAAEPAGGRAFVTAAEPAAGRRAAAAEPAIGRRAVVTAALQRAVGAVRPTASGAVRPTESEPIAPQQVRPNPRTAGVSPDAARRRGRVLAGLVVAAALGWVFAGVTPLPWLVPAVVTCVLVAFTVVLRRALVRERSAARRVARTTAIAPRQTVVGNPAAEPRDVRLARRAAVQAQVPAVVSPPEAEEDLVIDLRDVEPDRVAERFPSAPVGPGWLPVPVPVPTYTLKPKAPARPRAEAPVADAEPAPLDLDEIIERRIASGA